MTLSSPKPKIKTKAEYDAEVREGQVRLEKDTKVIALQEGYSDCIREPGDVFYVKKGTIYTPGSSWFEVVDDKTATKEETAAYDDMTIPQLKIELGRAGVDFAGITKKPDLVDLLVKSRAASDLA